LAHRLFYIIYETFEGGSEIESCGVTWKSEDEFLKSSTSATCIYIIIYETFKGGSGVESCGITWKSEEEFLKLGTSTAMKKILKLGLRQPLADKKRKLPASKVERCDENILVFRENEMDRENMLLLYVFLKNLPGKHFMINLMKKFVKLRYMFVKIYN
jgi:hypothetical protein